FSAGQEVAFEALLRRHGPLVWGVCLRVLRHEADAEDAFQATFLVLARKAASIADGAAVGSWLYGVAYHIALRARAGNRRRRALERRLAERPRREETEGAWQHLWPVVDAELTRLPEHYRAPIVLCDLEGLSLREAARQLGRPLGTVASCLARGRRLLAQRLSRRRLAVPGRVLPALARRHALCRGAPAPPAH